MERELESKGAVALQDNILWGYNYKVWPSMQNTCSQLRKQQTLVTFMVTYLTSTLLKRAARYLLLGNTSRPVMFKKINCVAWEILREPWPPQAP